MAPAMPLMITLAANSLILLRLGPFAVYVKMLETLGVRVDERSGNSQLCLYWLE